MAAQKKKKKGEKKRKTEEVTETKELQHSDAEPSDGSSREEKWHDAHVSVSGRILNAVKSSVAIAGHAFALFLGSQRSWTRPALDTAAAVQFQEACALHGFDPIHILPHGSYLMNCGSPCTHVFSKSQTMLVEELSRCSALGLSQFNFHPGASIDSTPEKCMEKIAQAINHTHQQTYTTLDSVCINTVCCHLDAPQMFLVCLVIVVHESLVCCHLDRHEDIGRGQIAITAFREIVNEPRLDNIPLILETPGGPGFESAEQIELHYSLCEKRRTIKHQLDASY
uniref:Si:ch211-141o9.10 n=1 Tax=Cyprinus carpio TaxID=7962 RepID=A0A8C1LEQ0_CYPCA